MTTGIICVCLPPLPILFRRRSSSQINTGYSEGSKRGPNSADRFGAAKRSGLYDDSYFELEEATQGEIPTDRVVTRVRGGEKSQEELRWNGDDIGAPALAHVKKKRSKSSDSLAPAERRERRTNGIMRTVKIEQQAA